MTGNERSPGQSGLPEQVVSFVFLLWLIWLPLPFGSVTEVSQPALLIFPLFIGLVAATVRLVERRPLLVPHSFLIWTASASLFIGVVAFQLAPLGSEVIAAISPMSHRLWSDSRLLYGMATNGRPEQFPHPEVLSIAPAITRLHLFRFISYLASFVCGSLLITTHLRRCLLAGVLGVASLFEVGYGIRELTLRHFEIWGWKNELILDRVSGTFVNPNHFANYLALAIPMGLFLAGAAWMQANRGRHFALASLSRMIERQLLLSSLGALIVVGCLTGILVAQSRGALLALAGGFTIVAGVLLRRNRKSGATKRMLAGSGIAVAVVVVGLGVLIALLGTDRTIGRFLPSAGEASTAVGRTTGIRLALEIWSDFPILGSGLGTFEQIVLTRQPKDLAKIYNHAHCDYAEILATTGVGFLVAVAGFFGGYLWLWREALAAAAGSRKHFLFLLTALTSISIAAIHALFDFNFYIPANAATLAAIAGSASALRDQNTLRLRRRRSIPGDTQAVFDARPQDSDPTL